MLKSKARHAAVSTLLTKPFYFEDKPLVVQYEVNFQEGQECGGAYLKLLTLDDKYGDLKQFQDKTPYTIMFGPDKCGSDHKVSIYALFILSFSAAFNRKNKFATVIKFLAWYTYFYIYFLFLAPFYIST